MLNGVWSVSKVAQCFQVETTLKCRRTYPNILCIESHDCASWHQLGHSKGFNRRISCPLLAQLLHLCSATWAWKYSTRKLVRLQSNYAYCACDDQPPNSLSVYTGLERPDSLRISTRGYMLKGKVSNGNFCPAKTHPSIDIYAYCIFISEVYCAMLYHATQ